MNRDLAAPLTKRLEEKISHLRKKEPNMAASVMSTILSLRAAADRADVCRFRSLMEARNKGGGLMGGSRQKQSQGYVQKETGRHV